MTISRMGKWKNHKILSLAGVAHKYFEENHVIGVIVNLNYVCHFFSVQQQQLQIITLPVALAELIAPTNLSRCETWDSIVQNYNFNGFSLIYRLDRFQVVTWLLDAIKASVLSFHFLFSGSLRGYTILGHDKLHDGLIGLVWHGKNFNYPNKGEARGIVTNSALHSFEVLRASIFPSIAPMDGKEAYEIDYKEDIASFLMVDYLRTVQPNLYLGYFAIRAFDKTPIGYFMLERV